MNWLVLVLPDCSLVFAFPAQLFECLLSQHGDLLERELVYGTVAMYPHFPAVVIALFSSQCSQ